MRSTNSATASSAKAFASESIGTRWRTLANFSDGFAPTLRLSLSGGRELGKAGLERLVAPAQGVVLRVRDRRRVLAVIAPVVLRDLGAERLVLGSGRLETRCSGAVVFGGTQAARCGHGREAS